MNKTEFFPYNGITEFFMNFDNFIPTRDN